MSPNRCDPSRPDEAAQAAQRNHSCFISVYRPIAGWKAIMYWYNPEGFWEPWQTSPFAFNTREQAATFATIWGRDEGVEVRVSADDEGDTKAEEGL